MWCAALGSLVWVVIRRLSQYTQLRGAAHVAKRRINAADIASVCEVCEVREHAPCSGEINGEIVHGRPLAAFANRPRPEPGRPGPRRANLPELLQPARERPAP